MRFFKEDMINPSWMSVVIIVAGLQITGAMATAATYHKSTTPKSLSEWNDSTDGNVSVCLTVNKTTFSPSEKIVIRCAARNITDKPLFILRPFGDRFHALSGGLHILGPEGDIKYSGPMKEYVLGTDSFHELKSGMVIDETWEIPKKYLKGLGDPGLYRMRYKYYIPQDTPIEQSRITSGKVASILNRYRYL